MKVLTFLVLSVLTMGPSIAPTLAASSADAGIVTLQRVPELEVVAGGSAMLELQIGIAPGYHLQAETPENEFLVPLEVAVDPGVARAGAAIYPAPELHHIEGHGAQWRIHTGRITVRIPVRVPADAAPGISVLRGAVRYQACSDNLCLAPEEINFCAMLRVTESATVVATP